MSEETYLYIIGESDPGCWNVKIGISRNPGNRLLELQSGHHSKLVVHRTYAFGTRREAQNAEHQYHEFFEGSRMCGEWFGITPDEAIEGIEEAPTWPVGGSE